MANNKKVNWSYDDVYGLAQQEGLWDTMSDADRQLAQSDPDTAMSVLNHKIGYRDATTDADRAYHHAAAQNDRKSAGYIGDSSGSGYYQVRRFSYDDAPTYASKYQGRIDALANQILNRAAFSYDPKTDPQYAAYKKEYAREGRRASEDALGQAAALTGGMPSTAAIVASQQAGDYYAAQMADKIPELYRLAYDMYVKEGDTQRANMSMLQALEEGDYNKYLNALKQYNTDRSFAYGVYSDDYNRDYQEERDKISDARYDDETSYERQMAFAKLAAQYGDYNGLRGLGINPYADLALSGGGSSGGGGGRSGGSGGGGYIDDDYGDNPKDPEPVAPNPSFKLVMSPELARQRQGTDYITDKDTAIQWMMDKGLSKEQARANMSGIKSETTWKADKANKSDKTASNAFASYEDYVRAEAAERLTNYRKSNR